MVSGIRIYVEGGGDGSDTKALVREGFGEFLGQLRDAARERRTRWAIVACGSRNSAFDDFETACRTHRESFNDLLVDSEGPVSGVPREHLQRHDGWTTPMPDDHFHLMVQTMEAWLIADISALERFYSDGFLSNSLPRNPDVEQIDKSQLESALKHATSNTQKGRYHKIRHGARLLGLTDPSTVRQRAAHCEKLFATVETMIARGA